MIIHVSYDIGPTNNRLPNVRVYIIEFTYDISSIARFSLPRARARVNNFHIEIFIIVFKKRTSDVGRCGSGDEGVIY